jgi:hypothetical protein
MTNEKELKVLPGTIAARHPDDFICWGSQAFFEVKCLILGEGSMA